MSPRIAPELTEGRRRATDVIRKHRLAETAPGHHRHRAPIRHDEARRRHVMSEQVEERLC